MFCVSGIGYPLPKRQTIRICDGHEDLGLRKFGYCWAGRKEGSFLEVASNVCIWTWEGG